MTPQTLMTFDGQEQSIADWALDYGITPGIIIDRLNSGWSIERSIIKPMVAVKGQVLNHRYLRNYLRRYRPIRCPQAAPGKRQRYELEGQSHTLTQWSKITGIQRKTLKYRLEHGWSFETAIQTPVRVRDDAANSNTPGVVSNFPAFEGTGAGCTSQETPEITFSEEANS